MKNARLSVVIGAASRMGSVRACLRALAGGEAEILVVTNLISEAAVLAAAYPQVHVLSRPDLCLMPALWEQGIRQSTGEVVALLSADCVPHDGWIARVLDAHQGDAAGIGGAIENDPASDMAGWALYFCRYSRYALPFEKRRVADFAGDHALYKREALDLCQEVRTNGFWEPEIHARLARFGKTLEVDPGLVVCLVNSETVFSFLKQRFLHGRQFARDRSKGMTRAERGARVASSPLLPGLLTYRVCREVFQRGRHVPQFLASLPLLVLFFSTWTAGEVCGYLKGELGIPTQNSGKDCP